MPLRLLRDKSHSRLPDPLALTIFLLHLPQPSLSLGYSPTSICTYEGGNETIISKVDGPVNLFLYPTYRLVRPRQSVCAYVYTCVCVCRVRGQLRCHSSGASTLFYGQDFSVGPGDLSAHRTGCPASSTKPPVFASPGLGFQACARHPVFHIGVGDRTQILMSAEQTVHQWSYLPSPPQCFLFFLTCHFLNPMSDNLVLRTLCSFTGLIFIISPQYIRCFFETGPC